MTSRHAIWMDAARMTQRYLAGVPPYLRRTIPIDECRSRVASQVEARAQSFLRVLERAVFDRPSSPFARLLTHAGIRLPDVARLVQRRGVEEALAELYDEGVYLTHAEAGGRVAIRRGSLRLEIRPGDLDNPLSMEAFTVTSGGSRSPGRRMTVDFDMLAAEAPHHGLLLQIFGLAQSPLAVWRDVPPAAAGIKDVFRFAKVGRPPQRWFTQYPFSPAASPRHCLFTAYAVAVSRLVGHGLPMPHFVPLAEVVQVARWLSDWSGRRRAVLDTTPSGAVRICAAAEEAGLDISGCVFVLGGETFTPSRQKALCRSRTRGLNRYAMAEVGIIGMPCANPSQRDAVHVMADKLAVLCRPTRVGHLTVDEIHLTTLHPASPRILINAATGDHAEAGEWACGCPLRRLGMRAMLRAIGSHEKLTGEGMTFDAGQISWIVDELLPGRFGGQPTDYQFMEEEDDGLTRLTLAVSRRVGVVDESEVIRTVLEALATGGAVRDLMAGAWRQGETLRVARREPHVTSALKILPLHVARRAGSAAEDPA